MGISKKTLQASQGPGNLPGGNGAHDSVQLMETARADTDIVLKGLESQLNGLSEAEAESRLRRFGMNEIAQEMSQSALMRLLSNIKNPLVLLLLALGVLSFLTGDLRATVVIFVMVVLGVVLRFFQEMRADNAAEKLQAMVSNTATLMRGGEEEEVSLKMLVPGDINQLTAGDMVPASRRRQTFRIRWNSLTSASWVPTWRADARQPWSSTPGTGPTLDRWPPVSCWP